MKITSISNTIRSNTNNSVSFQRKLKENEKPEYTHAIKNALDYLGIQNLSMIIHGSSFPSSKRDSAIGSPYSKGADKFVDFLKLNGFNAIQLGPGGTIGKKDTSPYISKVYAKNELFIDLEPLKTDKYGKILSEATYNKVTTKTKSTPNKNYNYTDFNKAFKNYDIAMKEAYTNFKYQVRTDDKRLEGLNQEFTKFKTENKDWLESDGLYQVLAKEHGTPDFNKWQNAVDKNLAVQLKSGDPKAKARYEQIIKAHGDEIEQNSFVQFLADKQLKEANKHHKEIGFNYIGDLLVGFSESDVWANQNAFLKGWKLGCPYGGANNGPQTWGIPVLDPKKLFNKDGSLGVSGKVLKDKISYSLKNYDNVRIDHALGLVDPYIYKEDTVEKDGNGGVRRDKLWANNVSYLQDIDPNGNFKKVLKEIVLPTFKEHGIDKNQAVWEDLCSNTPAFDYVYHNQEHLPGITQTEWRRAENSPAENWSLVGSHDSRPAQQMNTNSDAWNVDYLSGYLNPDPTKGKERAEYRDKIVNSPVEKVKAKFTELFRGSKNLQMMFVDFFGINKVYNYGGQDQPTNWKLRVDNDFEDDYYNALQDKNSYALNMPEILAQAVRAKNQMEVAKVSGDAYKANQLRTDLDNKLKPMLSTLDNFTKVLKEKEEIKATEPQKTLKVEPQKSETTTKKDETKVSNPISKSSSSVGGTTALAVGIAVVAAGVTKLINKFRHKKSPEQRQNNVA